MGGLWEELAFARNKYFPESCRLKLPWQMRHSAARHERNGLVSVTFISFSLGNSFTIVVLVALPSETFIISPFMYELTCQHMLKTVRILAFFFFSLLLIKLRGRRSPSLWWWNLLIFLFQDLMPISVFILEWAFVSKPKILPLWSQV